MTGRRTSPQSSSEYWGRDFDVFDVGDASRRITSHHGEVRVLPDCNRADLVLAAEEDRTVRRGDANGLDRRESDFDQQLDLALIANAGKQAAETNRIGSRDEEPARGDACVMFWYALNDVTPRSAH
jgi:hypothetical protein